MNKRGSVEFLCAVCDAVVESLERVGKQHHCIEGSALLAKVLHKLGFPEAYPITVRVRILNSALVKWVEEHVVSNDGSEPSVCKDENAVEIRLGDVASGSHDRWGGHLAVVLPHYFREEHALLDITIEQANRPEYEVSLAPICLKSGNDFVAGNCPLAISNVNGCTLVDTTRPNDHSYGNWEELMAVTEIDETAMHIAERLK